MALLKMFSSWIDSASNLLYYFITLLLYLVSQIGSLYFSITYQSYTLKLLEFRRNSEQELEHLWGLI